MFEKGLNSYQLKIIALICMVFDHIHYMFSAQIGVPYWFGIIGRIAAPIFIFMTANAMHYTRNRKIYLIRLYLFFCLMSIGNGIANTYFPHPKETMLIANIFSTLFMISFYIYTIDGLIKSIKEKKYAYTVGYIFAGFLPVISGMIALALISNDMIEIFKVYFTLVPSLIFVEGGPLFVIMGLIFYYSRNSKFLLSLFYILLSGFIFYSSAKIEISFKNLIEMNYQWTMIFALPLILSYNNEKGRSQKWLFYIFYPAHLYIFLAISRLIN